MRLTGRQAAALAPDRLTPQRSLPERSSQIHESPDEMPSVRSVLRTVLTQVDGVRAVRDAAPLDGIPFEGEPPRAVDAEVVEDATLRSIPVRGGPVPGFAAFLDGRQESRLVAWVGPVVPLVIGTVSAGIQRRDDRRLRSWGRTLVERRIYAPLALLDADGLRRSCHPLTVSDTLTGDDDPSSGLHPQLLQERARQAVARDRERCEQRVAAEWCAAERAPLFIDGGIAGSESLSRNPAAIGVVKSHRTIYGGTEGMSLALSLAEAERTSVMRIAPRGRTPVHSWYLRTRDPAGRDAFWGLVRVEVAEGRDVSERAELVSRWILAEGAPLAAPDPRWDRMTYGVRAVEQALGAVATPGWRS